MTCKDCKFFVQGKGKSGTCEKRPYVSDRRGGIQKIDGKPRLRYIYWKSNACGLFEKGE
jgi:hypothetical protein